MPLVKILQDYGAAEQYQIGDIVDITNPTALIAEGKVALVEEATTLITEPVTAEPIVTEEQVSEDKDIPTEESSIRIAKK